MSGLIFTKDCPVIKNISQSKKTLFFNSTDSHNLYESNKHLLGNEWYYYDKKIEYKYNSWGYRAKEFDDLENDYILTFGCSYTEGIGLHYDDLWSTKLSSKLGMDVLNMGMGGTGTDFQFYNTTLLNNYILKTNKPPKMVIYQWSFENRTTYSSKEYFDGDTIIKVVPITINSDYKGSAHFKEWYIHGFIENEGEMIKQSNILPIICNNIWKSMGVKVLNWSWNGDFNMKNSDIFSNDIKMNLINDDTNITARDCTHNGHLSQDIVVNQLLKKI